MKLILTLATVLALTGCGREASVYPYTVLHTDGSYTRTAVRPDGKFVTDCHRVIRSWNLINNDTTHAPDVTDQYAQNVCDVTIK